MPPVKNVCIITQYPELKAMNEKRPTSRERIFTMLKGGQVDHLPLMPITMQFACDRIGKKYYDYATDYRVLVKGQWRQTAEPPSFIQKILRWP
jgi:hypothetical protein